ncbi:MAG: ribosome biogenesis protein [Nitrososphaerales archaeon]
MLTLILADASLELVPRKIAKHSSVVKLARRKGKKPEEILLDRSYHHSAMLSLPFSYKRGRPDIVHFALLIATSSPLYRMNKLKIFVHTINDKLIVLSHGLRFPKAYHRFEGLMEQLFKIERIEYKGKALLELKEKDFEGLMKELKLKRVIGLSRKGKASTFEDVARKLEDNSAIVIGGFPKGSFTDKVLKNIHELYSVHKLSLETALVVDRILYEYEKVYQ